MKALSLTQPWASLVAHGLKRWETRSWYTSYRGPLAIHAAKGFPRYARDLCSDARIVREALASVGIATPADLPLGCIIAVSRIGVTRTTDLALPDGHTAQEIAFGNYAPGRWMWRLDDVRAVPLIPCKGALGLWRVPPEVSALLPQPAEGGE